MAGPPPAAFDEAAFRAGILLAMNMEKSGVGATFYIPSSVANPDTDDFYDIPLDPAQIMSGGSATTVTGVPVAYSYVDSTEDDVKSLSITPQRLKIIFFEEDYQSVAGHVGVTIDGGNYYALHAVAPPISLFTVTFREVYYKTSDA